ncbi:LacI family DNA-binding transcriptional regulator [Pseudooceanicola sediminis]|uniref:LacI family DNA-binding transcriptional regulator n=1 Tax=Pseudooceanicola sediminis TaxID=2211117 RepID=A0A399J293_9RHOB|nr:LacI family DNA-binding transcriptional regulator [Pseudooceanicola sediminis]KAA2311564.1 substrate-binding domain-containing protein [Puniceibacterium sp. HSS470]RII37066.1 LacI family DNA-binding transcriptional regulator [Pseudooceanicola sediminis]|tara:strand:+ start:14936 stop:15967 length:1032 start_codon:yes stop_codon:yes gene_type:complete
MDGDQNHHKPKGRVTLLDVAKASGFSKSTVSRILDERLPTADNPSARHVREVAEKLGYVRDLSAANLRRGSTGQIGVIVPRLTDTVMAMLYESLAKAAGRNGQFAIVATTDDHPDAGRAAAEALIRRGVDGLILSTARIDDHFTDELRARHIPFVLALRQNGQSLAAIGDDPLGGYLATRHLLDLGHRRIGLITGPDYATSARGRLEGYCKALEEASVSLSSDLIVPSTFSIESGELAAETLLKLKDRPTAIFAVNDNTAIGALSAIASFGFSVPHDISLVGYNDIPIVSRLPVPLTTVKVPFDHIAEMALQLLNNASEGSSEVRIATPSLIPRKSTAAPRSH